MVVPRRPSPEHIAARRSEIAARYAWHKKVSSRRPRSIAAIRISELTRLLDARYGRMRLPESDDTLLAVLAPFHPHWSLLDPGVVPFETDGA
jgi:hypothetical protein